jgi:hypothetical protein
MSFEFVKPEGVSRDNAISIMQEIKKHITDCCVEQKKDTPFVSFNLMGEETNEYGSGFNVFLKIPEENRKNESLDGLTVDYYLNQPMYSLILHKYPENHLIFRKLGRYDKSIGYGIVFNSDTYTWRYNDAEIKEKIELKMESWINRLTLKNVRTI